MKSTPLTDKHIALGAKMADFAGYHMPIVYSTISNEHDAVRNSAGIFDVSHMGEFIVKGRQALDLVQKVTSNDASLLEIGYVQYSCFPNDHGGIVDDLLVYRLPEEKCSEGERAYMLVVNASNIQKDWDWVNSKNTFDAEMTDISEKTGLLAVQGPKAIEILQRITTVNLSEIEYYHFTKGQIAGIDQVLISNTGYTGSGGFELYAKNEDIVHLWDAIMDASVQDEIMPCGLGARDTLRLEMGFCLYGNDINDDTSPLEAGLGWITKLKKDADFSSKNIFLDQKANGLKKKLVGIVIEDRRVPRHGYTVVDEVGYKIGEVTSGTQSPSLDIPIGMAYIDTEYATLDKEIFVIAGSKSIKGRIVKFPFVKFPFVK